jgi:hypothetical protein
MWPERMPFGKHRGWLLSELPDDYLDWLLHLDNLRPPLRRALDAEARQREPAHRPAIPILPCVKPDLAAELIEAGRRAVAARHHPDRGGDGEHLAALNDAADRLLGFFGSRREGVA